MMANMRLAELFLKSRPDASLVHECLAFVCFVGTVKAWILSHEPHETAFLL